MYYEFMNLLNQGSKVRDQISKLPDVRWTVFVYSCICASVFVCSCVLGFRIYGILGPGHVFGLNSIQVRSGQFGIIQHNTA